MLNVLNLQNMSIRRMYPLQVPGSSGGLMALLLTRRTLPRSAARSLCNWAPFLRSKQAAPAMLLRPLTPPASWHSCFASECFRSNPWHLPYLPLGSKHICAFRRQSVELLVSIHAGMATGELQVSGAIMLLMNSSAAHVCPGAVLVQTLCDLRFRNDHFQTHSKLEALTHPSRPRASNCQTLDLFLSLCLQIENPSKT